MSKAPNEIDIDALSEEEKDGLLRRLLNSGKAGIGFIQNSGILELNKQAAYRTAERRIGISIIDNMHHKVLIPNCPALLRGYMEDYAPVMKFVEAQGLAMLALTAQHRIPEQFRPYVRVGARAAAMAAMESLQQAVGIETLLEKLFDKSTREAIDKMVQEDPSVLDG